MGKRMLAVIDDPAECESAIRDLGELGLGADDVRTVIGTKEAPGGREAVDEATDMLGEIGVVVAAEQERYVEALRGGASLIGVVAREVEPSQIADVLTAHGAHDARVLDAAAAGSQP